LTGECLVKKGGLHKPQIVVLFSHIVRGVEVLVFYRASTLPRYKQQC
jgi:hypothetical protein